MKIPTNSRDFFCFIQKYVYLCTMNTLYVNYTIYGKPISDYMVEEELEFQAAMCVNGADKQFNVSTENVINAVRCMKLSGKITCDVKVMFEGNDLPMNQYCKIDDWPIGFCDYNEKWISGCLRSQMDLYKKNKSKKDDEKNDV